MNTVEFRDAGGGYVVAQPFDDVRCQVLASNLLEKGRVLWKPPQLSWEEAGEDLGGFTRLDPCDFGTVGDEDPAEASLLTDLERAASYSGRPTEGLGPSLEQVPDPASLAALADEEDSPRALVARLAAHYVARHRDRSPEALPQDVCRCAGFRAGGSRREARLHALLALSTTAKAYPDLDRLVGAFQKHRGKEVLAA